MKSKRVSRLVEAKDVKVGDSVKWNTKAKPEEVKRKTRTPEGRVEIMGQWQTRAYAPTDPVIVEEVVRYE